MDNQQVSSKQIMLNYGLILGFLTILTAVLNFAFGNIYDPSWIISVASILSSVIIIVLGLKALKQGNNGFLSLGESLKTGVGISLIAGIIYVLYFFVFVNFIEAEYFTKLAEFQEATVIEMYPEMSDEQLENALEMSKKFSGFGMIAAITIIMSLFSGFVVSLIAGLIMKRVPEED